MTVEPLLKTTEILLIEKAHKLKVDYDDVSAGMGRIYYKGFSENEIVQFESYLERIQKNLEGWREE